MHCQDSWIFIVNAERAVVPMELPTKVLKQVHFGHKIISHMKDLAHSFVYWPDIDSQFGEFVLSCSKC